MDALPLITNLKKLCNHPDLIYSICREGQSSLPVGEILPLFPEDYDVGDAELSGKMLFTDKLLSQIREFPTKDRVVIVSNYTETLGVLAGLCKRKGYPYFQLVTASLVLPVTF
jgi:SNF2 family DNA or RNA helicase